MISRVKLSWFEASKWAAVFGVAGGLAAGFLSDAQINTAAGWATIVQAAGLAIGGAAGAFLVAIKRGR